jgi:predicted anti-sigma-YlaC factor YlaD
MNDLPNNVHHLSDELLSERLDATLTVSQQAAVDAHLAECAECAARYAGLQSVRTALAGLRVVGAVPDFRLTDQGQPRRGGTVRPMPITPNPIRARGAQWLSAAVMLCGIVLIALSLGSGTLTPAQEMSAAGASNPYNSSVTCPPKNNCSAHQSVPGSTTPTAHPTTTNATTTQSGTSTPTVTSTVTSTPTTAALAGTSTTSPNESAAPSSPLSPLELIAGVLLVLGGFFTLLRSRAK